MIDSESERAVQPTWDDLKSAMAAANDAHREYLDMLLEPLKHTAGDLSLAQRKWIKAEERAR